MAKTIDKAKLIQGNPQINARELDESLVLAQELARQGVEISRYDLNPPFSRSLHVAGGTCSDPRTAYLGR